MITGDAIGAAGITAEVGPGGGLLSLELPDRALRLGTDGLAGAILDVVHAATARANLLTRAELGGTGTTGTAGLAADLDAIGLTVDPTLTDALEETTPDTWMR